MRRDMQKVIVERPRHGGHDQIHRPKRNDEDWSVYPKRESMRRCWKDRKELSDNLNPLWRYLDKQVGRLWDDVWSEISATLDFRGVLGFHVKSHIDEHVQLHVRLINGEPHEVRRYGDNRWEPVTGLYVHPKDGTLRQGPPRYPHTRYRSPFEQRVEQGAVKIVDTQTQLHKVKGCWFLVTLAPIPMGPYLDALGTPFPDKYAEATKDAYGREGVYAMSKRQISRRAKKRYGVA